MRFRREGNETPPRRSPRNSSGEPKLPSEAINHPGDAGLGLGRKPTVEKGLVVTRFRLRHPLPIFAEEKAFGFDEGLRRLGCEPGKLALGLLDDPVRIDDQKEGPRLIVPQSTLGDELDIRTRTGDEPHPGEQA